MKKLISLLLVVMLLASCIPSFADDTWTISAEGALKVSSGVTLSGEVVIPDVVDGVNVTSLDGFAFNNQNDVTSIVMPDTIQSMSGSAINFLNGLTSVKLSENLTVIDSMNFCAMKGLTELTIPASVCFIGDSFSSLQSLQTLTFEGVCPMFGIDAPLSGLNRNCVVYVPDDQVEAYKAALTNGYGTEGQIQPSGKNAVIYDSPAAEADFVFDAATGAITGYTGTSARLQIPAAIGGVAVTAIAEKAFYGNSALCYVIVPEGIETIGNYAFGQCDNLLVVDFPTTLKKIGDGAFEGCYLDSVGWKEGLEEIGANAFSRYGVQNLTLPSTVKTIGEAAFKNGSIRKLYIGNQIESIGPEAFANNFLDRVELLTDRMIQIDETAFAGNANDTYVYLRWNVPYDVYKEYEHLFLNIYEGITYLYIQAPIKDPSLGLEYPADGTDSYNQEVWVSYSGTQPNLMTWYSWNRIPITTLGDGLFKGNQTIRSWYCSHEFTMHHIGNEAFADSSVEIVDLYHEIYTIGDAAFRNCVNIKEITLPETLTSIAANAFEGCTGLEKITILCDPSILPAGLLDSCTALTEISAGENATEEQKAALQKAVFGKEIVITQQPADAVAAEGETVTIEVQLEDSEGLSFTWYVRNMKDKDFTVDAAMTGNSYSVVADASCDGRMVYCEISDGYGTVVETDTAMITIATPLAITVQPAEVELPEGEMTNITVEATGDGLTYQWYVMPVSKSDYAAAEGFSTNVYSVTVNADSDWSKVYCEITDEYGNTVKSDEVTIFMAEPEAVVPVGEVDENLVGHWITVSANVEGMVLSQKQLEDLGMSMWIDLNADGTAAMYMEGEAMDGISWGVADGMLALTLGGDSVMIEILEDGTLSMEGIVFALEGSAPIETPVETPVDTPAVAVDASTVFGKWIATGAEMDGMKMDKAMLTEFGLTVELVVNEDGTASLSMEGETEDGLIWTSDDAGITLTMEGESMPVTFNDKGGLTMDFGGVYMFLDREGAETTAPVEKPVENPVDLSGSPVIGVWNDGEGTTFTVNADGTCVATDEWGNSDMEWTIVDDVPTITTGSWFGAPMILNDDGTLYVNDGFFIDKTLMPGAYVAPDLSSSPVVGVWNDGKGMTFTVNADGTCVATDKWGDNNMEWNIQDGVPMINSGSWYGAPMILNEDGTLYVSDGWVVDTTFMPGELTSGDATAPVVSGNVAGTADDFAGSWKASTMEMEGMTMDVAALGMIMDLTIDADGTIAIFDGESTETGFWTLVDGALDIMGEMQLALAEDGRLYMVDDGAVMYFVRSEETGSQAGGDASVADAAPISGETEDFVGRWIGAFMEADGMTVALSDIGMTMELEFDAYGNVTLYDGEATEEGFWTLVDGKADIDGMICYLMNDGTMIAEDPDGAKVVFKGFVGTWKACYLSTGGLTGDLRSLGITSTLVLNADGTGSIDFPTPEEGNWYTEDGYVRFGENGMPMQILPGGYLKFGSDLAGYLVFSQDENAAWDPSMEAVAPAATPEPVVIPEATTVPAQAPESDGAADMQALMNRKYVAKKYSSFGQTMDASMLGGEYSLVFRENGTCDFGIAGMVVPNLSWGLQKVATGLTEVDAFVINYYGTMFNAVLTDAGFDMDFYGTMTLHFVPAE